MVKEIDSNQSAQSCLPTQNKLRTLNLFRAKIQLFIWLPLANCPNKHFKSQQRLFSHVKPSCRNSQDKAHRPQLLVFSVLAPFCKTYFCTVSSNPRTRDDSNFLDCRPNIESDHGVFPQPAPSKCLIFNNDPHSIIVNRGCWLPPACRLTQVTMGSSIEFLLSACCEKPRCWGPVYTAIHDTGVLSSITATIETSEIFWLDILRFRQVVSRWLRRTRVALPQFVCTNAEETSTKTFPNSKEHQHISSNSPRTKCAQSCTMPGFQRHCRRMRGNNQASVL